jgi:hypothetical protein
MPGSKNHVIRPRASLRRTVALIAAAALSVPAAYAVPAHASAGVATAPNSSGSPAPVPASSAAHTTSTLQDDSSATVAQREAMARASATAHTSGKPVAVDALTTETYQLIAQPKGGFSLVANPLPVRTKQHGAWVPVNTALHKNSDGTLSPAATAYGTVAFSGGGHQPLATTSSGSTSYQLSWPGTLPTPTVTGDTATYPGVLPGVDLKVSANPFGGFSDVLVVKTPAAAKNPQLRALTLAARTLGGHAAKSAAADAITIAGANGGLTLDSSSAVMWDSNTTPAKGTRAQSGKSSPDASDAAHAGLVAHTALVGVHASNNSLTLVPDAGLLTSPSAVLPIYIDPTLAWHQAGTNAPAFDEVKQGSPCNAVSSYNNTGSTGDYGQLGVGVNNYGGGCGGIQRAYYQWSIPAALHGADVSTAQVNATEVYQAQWSCSYSRTVNLHWAGGIGSGTDYNNQPGFMTGSTSYSTSTTVGAAYNANGCKSPSTSAAGFNVLTPIQYTAAHNGTQFTAVLTQDAMESSNNDAGFDRFSGNPTLNILFNRRPVTPGATDLAATDGATDNAACATTAPYPYIGEAIAANPPVLSAHISDPDGDSLQAQFQYWIDGSSTTATLTSADNLGSGTKTGVPLPTSFTNTLTNGQIVDWHARVTDGEQSGGSTVWTGWSPTCHFIAEPTAPLAPAIAANTTYPYGGTGASAGTPAVFTVTGASGGPAATKFVYGLDQSPATSNPPVSQIAEPVGAAASSPAHRWLLSGTGTDSIGTSTVTLASGASWGTDPTRQSVLTTTNTATSYATAGGPLLNTTASYSVSAWVKLTSTAGDAVAVSQAGTNLGAFFLGYDANKTGWCFYGYNADVPSSSLTNWPGVCPTTDHPTLNTWTLLTGVYDASAKTRALYVNGTLIGTGSDTTAFATSGALTIGDERYNSAQAFNFPGQISDVQIYPRALTATEASAIYNTNNANITITPPYAGPHTLYIYAVDAAGDVSGATSYPFTAVGHATTSCDSLALCYNNTAISPDGNPALANADGSGHSLSATDLTNAGWTTGSNVIIDGANLTLPAFGSGQKDNVIAANQTVTYSYPTGSTGNSSLMILATSTYGNQAEPGAISGDTTAPYVPAGTGVVGTYCFDSTDPAAFCAPQGTIIYSDGTTQPYDLTVPDWTAGPSPLAAVTLPHLNSPGGQSTPGAGPKLYPFSIPLTTGKTVSKIVLPDTASAGAAAPALHIFSIGGRNTTTGTATAAGSTAAAANSGWTGAWGAPTEGNYNFQGANFTNQTFRIAVKPSVSGGAVRVKLDNALGLSPLSIGSATIAPDSPSGALPTAAAAATPTALTFSITNHATSSSVTIPEGGMVYSNPLTFAATANQWLLVSFRITGSVPYLVEHSWANTSYTYLSATSTTDYTGDTAATHFTGSGTYNGWFTNLLTGLDVQTTGYQNNCTTGTTTTACTTGIPTQVVLGDGLIDAWQPNTQPLGQNTALRLSDDLAADEPTTPGPYGTVAAGIESNQIMKDNPETYSGSAVGGPSALSRVDRDVLDQPGLSTVVLFEGLEDLLNGQTSDNLDNNGYAGLLTYFQATDTTIDAVGLTPCDGFTGDGATANDPCTATVDGYRTAADNWLNGSDSLQLNPWSSPPMFYINTDAAVGVPDTANGETKLDPNAAIGSSNGGTVPDYANLTLSGYGALTSAILSAQNTWLLTDGPGSPTANDTASNTTNAYLAHDPAAGANAANLNGTEGTNYTWTTDSTRGTVLQLDGTTGYGATTGPVLNTAASFTVSAWVKLPALPTNHATVFAQEGTNNSGFYLWYNTGWNGWAFSFASNDTTTYTWNAAGSSAGAAVNTWTHVVGAYNAATHTAQLYLNGTLAATGTGITNWNATGPLLLGAAKTAGTLGNYFPGEISNAQAWNYALSAPQISALYNQIS